MGHPPRFDTDLGVHHVLNRGVDRQPIFFADSDRVEFGRRLADIHEHLGVETLAYCLMTNHYHLLLRTPDGGLSDAMHRFGSVYTRHTNDRVGRDGPLFRGRFRSIPVQDDAYLQWVTRYIHRNALDLPGIQRADDYRWSSLRTYLGCRVAPAFMNLELVLGLHGDDRARMAAYTFDDQGSPPTSAGPKASTLRTMIELAIAADQLIHDDAAKPQRLARTIEVLLLDYELSPSDQRLVAASHQFPSRGARTQAIARARRRLAADPIVGRVIRSLLTMIDTGDGVCLTHSVT